MSQVDLEVRPLLADLISCILGAVRPLSRGELQDAVDILHQAYTAYTWTIVPLGDVFGFLDQHLPGVFDFSRGEVRLQHPDLKHLFFSASNSWYGGGEQEAEQVIARICLSYLRSSVFALTSKAMLAQWNASRSLVCHSRANLADYAVRHWNEHACRVSKGARSFENEILEFFNDDHALRSWEMGRRAISNPVLRDIEVTLPPLALIASAGLREILKLWIETFQYDRTCM